MEGFDFVHWKFIGLFDPFHLQIIAVSCEWQVTGWDGLLSRPHIGAHVIRDEMALQGRGRVFDWTLQGHMNKKKKHGCIISNEHSNIKNRFVNFEFMVT